MAAQKEPPPSLTSFAALSFDVYATLIDWENGIYTSLRPMNCQLAHNNPFKDNKPGLLGLYTKFEGELQEAYPGMKYAPLLGLVYKKMAEQLGVSATDSEQATFGASVGQWPAFSDTVEALKKLGKRYKLIVLSNVDGDSFSRTLTGPLNGIVFDAVYMAEQIGSYKPDLRNFEYMIEHAGADLRVARNEILHTAQALWHDHVPARKVGLESCWIMRGGKDSAMGGDLDDLVHSVSLAYRFTTLGEMADAVENAFQTHSEPAKHHGTGLDR